MLGIEFTFNDGTKESYDPIANENELIETEEHYVLNLTYDYTIEKNKVKHYRFYEVCPKCGFEMCEDLYYDYAVCHNNNCSKNVNSILSTDFIPL